MDSRRRRQPERYVFNLAFHILSLGVTMRIRGPALAAPATESGWLVLGCHRADQLGNADHIPVAYQLHLHLTVLVPPEVPAVAVHIVEIRKLVREDHYVAADLQCQALGDVLPFGSELPPAAGGDGQRAALDPIQCNPVEPVHGVVLGDNGSAIEANVQARMPLDADAGEDVGGGAAGS